MFGDEPSESWLAVWFRSLTMGTRIQIILFSVLGILLAIGVTIALIKEPAILLPAETPDSKRVAGEPERPKAPDEAKSWRKAEGIMAQSMDGNLSVESQGEIQAMRKLVKMSPQDAEAWDKLGKSLYVAGLYDEAVNAFRESLKIKPNVVDVLANLGVALKTRGREAEYKKLLEELNLVDAKTAKELENFVPQNRAASPSISPTRPSFSEVGSGSTPPSSGKKGPVPQNQGEIDALRKLVAMDERDPDAWDKLGKALYLAGQYGESVDCFRKSLTIKPDVIEVLANLGVTLKTKGDQALYEEVVQKLSGLDAKTAEDLKKFEPLSARKP
ncbi:MAG: tetratricopeptide repeat protein [Verrucomicrobia bacterium]|nr:tetratricopeptide repeat protein [Verrucomicrobiota bacterium]